MKDKKGFLLYRDMLAKVETLSDDMAGKLFKTVLRYTNDKDIDTSNELLNYAFVDIKTQLDRDAEKYVITCQKNKDNANKRWNKKNASASDGIGSNAKDADRDSDIDSDIDIKKTAKSYDYAEEIVIFNSIVKHFESKHYNTEAKKKKWLDTIRLLHSADGYDYETIKEVILYAKNDTFWSPNVLSISSIRKKTNDVSKFDNIKAKYDSSNPVRKNKLTPKLHYATQEELLKEFKTEQAIIDISKENTYVCNAKGVLFPLRDKNKSRNREGEYILGADRKLYKITI